MDEFYYSSSSLSRTHCCGFETLDTDCIFLELNFQAIHVHPGWNILKIKSRVLAKKGFKTMTVSLSRANKRAAITKTVIPNEFSEKNCLGIVRSGGSMGPLILGKKKTNRPLVCIQMCGVAQLTWSRMACPLSQ